LSAVLEVETFNISLEFVPGFKSLRGFELDNTVTDAFSKCHDDSLAEPRTTEPRIGLLSEWTQPTPNGTEPRMDPRLMDSIPNRLIPECTQPPKWAQPRMD
jgi:hypothetical protein